ncbi:reticulon-1-A-like isoform X3 [Babylonia areolata]|uniref:reticulon-1-A-like isoform X3 n=1 Tax=Babylonia areolata TaxID=304850 RepID=UPI003FD38A99
MSDFSDLSRPELQGLDQSESNNIVSDGFETLDPVGSDVYESQPQGTIPEQDEEITTTNAFGGEEPAEEDRYAAGQWLKNVDPRAPSVEEDLSLFLDLIYWRDVRKTGVVFGSMMLVLLSLACFSLMSVLAYLSLAILTVTLSFRVYKNIMAAVQKTNDGHPFKQYLDLDITLKEEKVSRVTQTVLQHVNRSMLELRRLFLIEDLVDSIKFGLLLWVLTYIGSWFNGMTLIILLVIAIFSLPKVYETYKVQIDNYVNMATTQLNTILAQVQSKVPFLKKKAKAQ